MGPPLARANKLVNVSTAGPVWLCIEAVLQAKQREAEKWPNERPRVVTARVGSVVFDIESFLAMPARRAVLCGLVPRHNLVKCAWYLPGRAFRPVGKLLPFCALAGEVACARCCGSIRGSQHRTGCRWGACWFLVSGQQLRPCNRLGGQGGCIRSVFRHRGSNGGKRWEQSPPPPPLPCLPAIRADRTGWHRQRDIDDEI